MEFFIANYAAFMFAGLICFLLLGFPVAFSLGACGLFFGLLGIELNVFPASIIAWLPQRLLGIRLLYTYSSPRILSTSRLPLSA